MSQDSVYLRTTHHRRQRRGVGFLHRLQAAEMLQQALGGALANAGNIQQFRFAIANLAPLDAVATTVGGTTAEKLIAKVKPGGVYASVVEVPQNAAKYPSVKVVHVFSKFDRKTLEFMAEAVRDGKLVIPISQKLALSDAAEAQATAEKGGIGKILLVA